MAIANKGSHFQTADGGRQRVLWLSTIAFTLMFNVWLMLGVLAPRIKETLGLSPAQVEWLIAASALPALTQLEKVELLGVNAA